MTKDKALMIEERINDATENAYKETAVIAEIGEIAENDFRVDVRPGKFNFGDSFHHIETIADISRGFGVHTYAVIENSMIYVKIF